MLTIETRLSKLEQATAATAARECGCADRVRVIWPDDRAEPGPERCDTCAGVRQTVRVKYDV